MKTRSNQIRVRFAPSPTGELHIGGARTALFDFLFAKHLGGKIVLRIEDTDQKRFVAGSVERLVESMKWLGIEFDEGVELTENEKLKTKNLDSKLKTKNENCEPASSAGGLKIENLRSVGPYGPYIQSQRLGIYQEYAQKLLEDGHAYYCFCSEERLKKMRETQIKNKQASMYDKTCLKLSGEEVEKNLKAKKPYVIRLKVPEGGKTSFDDLIHGHIEVDNYTVDDQVLIKSDGMPTYHLAVVIDDYLMKITHIFRGEEWLSSTPKQIILYESLDWEIPQFAHLPTILGVDRKKLSKREGSVSVEEFRKQGYLPQALVNFIALIGWSPKNDKELFSMDELIKEFDIKNINRASGVFDRNKLDHFNSHYIRQIPDKELARVLNCKESTANIVKERMVKLSDFPQLIGYQKKPVLDRKKLIFKKSTKENTLIGLKETYSHLQGIKKISTKDEAQKILESVVKDNKLANGDVYWSVRYALSGLEASPSPQELMWDLGLEKSQKRILEAIKLLE